MIEILWFLSEQLLRHRDSYEDERSENAGGIEIDRSCQIMIVITRLSK